jgi:hypothetical protein
MNRGSKLLGLVALLSSGAAAASAVTVERDAEAVRSVLRTYDAAVERLDPRGTEVLFESGGREGNYTTYFSHHLTPELAEFRSFKFSDYRVSVRFEGSIALATETYRYRIETKKGEIAERVGAATSVLKKVGNRWQILVMHSSAHKPSAS